MTQGSDGVLYGTLSSGLAGSGGIYSIDNNLTPPAPVITELYPPTGSAGTSVLIRGSHFLSTSSVTLSGVAAPYTVPSDEFVKITIPTGAVTAPLVIATPNGTGVGATPFIVHD